MAEGFKRQSPDFVKMSHATAISLGMMRGRMYRGAINKCVNLLVHYPEGCAANCAYCGLAKRRPGKYRDKSFIHVDWPIFSLDHVIGAIQNAPEYVKRTCISMITNGKCTGDTLKITLRLRNETSLPISILTSPTIIEKQDLLNMKENGADKIGIAIDCATPELFDAYRGKGVSGPHIWERYWQIMETALTIFNPYDVGAHLMVGMGETEKEMTCLMDRLWNMGVANHLFSFFPEKGSQLADMPQPAWDTYLRIQLARYLIEQGMSRYQNIAFDEHGCIMDYGVSRKELDDTIGSGVPFMTTGCLGSNGEVACNRPFGNCLPDVKQWNYPYPPNNEEIDLIRQNIFYDSKYLHSDTNLFFMPKTNR